MTTSEAPNSGPSEIPRPRLSNTGGDRAERADEHDQSGAGDDPRGGREREASVFVTYRTTNVFRAASASSQRALATRKACRSLGSG
jgi:hypothetical protein